MEKILKYLSAINQDKLLHFFYGMLIWEIVSLFNTDIAILSVIFIAISKEVYDEYLYNGFDGKDIFWTIWLPILLYIKETSW